MAALQHPQTFVNLFMSTQDQQPSSSANCFPQPNSNIPPIPPFHESFQYLANNLPCLSMPHPGILFFLSRFEFTTVL